jgi:transposase-like protein
MRKIHSKDFKFKVAIEALRGDLTIAQIVSKYQVAESL